MANILFIQNKLGRTDGVSLEVDKWRAVLERMGHTVFYCAGNDEAPGIDTVPELYLQHPLTYKILRNGTVELADYADESELARDIEIQAERIHAGVMRVVKQRRIDVLIPNNLLSIGYNLPAVPALYRVIEETGLPTIAHCHDFYFEDSGEVEPTCETVRRLLDAYAPPQLPNVQVLTINRLAEAALRERKGIEATVVPNVWDFRQPAWELDDYNADFREAIGVGAHDLLFLQATRIMNRKGVELAIDVVAELQQPEHDGRLRTMGLYDGRPYSGKIVLVCAGYVEKFGITGNYYDDLVAHADARGVDLRFVGDMVGHSRATAEDGRKQYSLWDCYVHADFVTYPSLWEGWGNQLIEAVFARLPVVLYEYPVYGSDLKAAGFQAVSLGDSLAGIDARGLARLPDAVLARAAGEIVDLLTKPALRQATVDHNFAVAAERYSFETLEGIIAELLGKAGQPAGIAPLRPEP
jgi:glycosyltransferase involved in cell wall biosynthesis